MDILGENMTKIYKTEEPCTILVILKFDNILVQVRFTSKKARIDIHYKKLGICVTERLKTLEILDKSQIWVEVCAQSPFQKLIAVKKHAKVDIKVFQPCPIFLNFFTLIRVLVPLRQSFSWKRVIIFAIFCKSSILDV